MEKSRKQFSSSEKVDLDVDSYNNSGEFKPPPLPERSPRDSPEGSSISSDHTSLTHGSSPTHIREDQTTPSSPSQNPPEKFTPKPQAPSLVINRYAFDGPTPLKKKADRSGQVVIAEEGGEDGGSGQRFRPSLSILKSARESKW